MLNRRRLGWCALATAGIIGAGVAASAAAVAANGSTAFSVSLPAAGSVATSTLEDPTVKFIGAGAAGATVELIDAATGDAEDPVTIGDTDTWNASIGGLPVNQDVTVKARYKLKGAQLTKSVKFVHEIAPNVVKDIAASAITHDSATLGWSKGVDDGTVEKYTVTVLKGDETVSSQEVTGLTAAIKDLDPETDYKAFVEAVDNDGHVSAAATAFSFSTVAESVEPGDDIELPSAPTKLTATAEGENALHVMWDQSTDNVAVDHYEVYLDGEHEPAETVTHDPHATSGMVVVRGLEAGTDYTVKVAAFDRAGNKSLANPEIVGATAGSGLDDAPKNLSATDRVYQDGVILGVDGQPDFSQAIDLHHFVLEWDPVEDTAPTRYEIRLDGKTVQTYVAAGDKRLNRIMKDHQIYPLQVGVPSAGTHTVQIRGYYTDQQYENGRWTKWSDAAEVTVPEGENR